MLMMLFGLYPNNKNKMNKFVNIHLWLGAFFIFLFDFLTKLWALYRLPLDSQVVSRSWFSLQRIYNETTIFLNYDAHELKMSEIQFRLFYCLIAMVLLLGTVWVSRQKSMNDGSVEANWAKTGLFIIMGGMFGNLFDRIFRTGVVDFIRIDLFVDTIPIINIADIMIYVGEGALLYVWLRILTKFLLSLIMKKVK